MTDDFEPSEHLGFQPEHVGLNEEFLVFPAGKTTIKKREQSGVNLISNEAIVLKIPELGNIPIRIATDVLDDPDERRKKDVICPFNPELGYWVTGEDFKIETRVVKLRSMGIELDREVDFDKAPLIILSSTDIKYNSDLYDEPESIPDYKQQFAAINPESRKVLERLRLQLFFHETKPTSSEEISNKPNRPYRIGAFEAAPKFVDGSGADIQAEQLLFSGFYPLDTGPLPNNEQIMQEFGTISLEGFDLLLPADFHRLGLTKARFVLVEDKPESQKSEETE